MMVIRFNFLISNYFIRSILCKSIMLPVVLYGSETWSVTLSEDRRLRVFGNLILRRIFRPKRDQGGDLRKLQNSYSY